MSILYCTAVYCKLQSLSVVVILYGIVYGRSVIGTVFVTWMYHIYIYHYFVEYILVLKIPLALAGGHNTYIPIWYILLLCIFRGGKKGVLIQYNETMKLAAFLLFAAAALCGRAASATESEHLFLRRQASSIFEKIDHNGNDHCTRDHPCGLCEGDCDSGRSNCAGWNCKNVLSSSSLDSFSKDDSCKGDYLCFQRGPGKSVPGCRLVRVVVWLCRICISTGGLTRILV